MLNQTVLKLKVNNTVEWQGVQITRRARHGWTTMDALYDVNAPGHAETVKVYRFRADWHVGVEYESKRLGPFQMWPAFEKAKEILLAKLAALALQGKRS